MLIISDEIRNVYPEASLGLLVINNVCNPDQHEKLQRCKIELENNLREKYASLDKSYPTVSLLVEAMFMAEMKNLLLTAGHDLDTIDLPIKLDIAKGEGDEKFTQITGQEKTLIKNDMFVSDLQGITSSIIYGPDERTRIKSDTKNVLFVVYVPPGIGKERALQHLDDIQKYVELISPKGKVELLRVYTIKDKLV